MGLTIRILVLLCLPSFLGEAFADNYSDIWWNPTESGWGFTIADHETNLFGVLYAYRSDGRPVWFTLPGGTFSQGRRIFQGDVYVTHGPPYTNATFDPTQVSVTKVGSAMLDFAPAGAVAGSALLSYTINGVSQTKQIQRQPFGTAPPNWGSDGTDLWYNASESGWGLSLAQHGSNIFAVWYTYDTDGEPLWFVLPGGSFPDANTFSGALYRTTGPYFGNPTFDPSAVAVTLVGNATITFRGTPGMAAPIEKEASCGFSANFVVRLNSGPGVTPRIICQQPFGNPRPSRSVDGTYSGNAALMVQGYNADGSPDGPPQPYPYPFTVVLANGSISLNGQPVSGSITSSGAINFSAQGSFASSGATCNFSGVLTATGGSGTVHCNGLPYFTADGSWTMSRS